MAEGWKPRGGIISNEAEKRRARLAGTPDFINESDEERKRKKRNWKKKEPAKPPAGVAGETKSFYDRKRQESQLQAE